MGDLWNEIFEDPKAPLTEEFDPTWPYNLKWSFNVQTGQTDVWRVMGGKDGRPSHRAEAERLWGRKPNVQSGDVLGVATYIPAETKIDGTVVAPPDVQMQAYYGMAIPPGVRQWFEDHFPDAVVRQATVIPPRLGSKKKATEDWDLTPVVREDPVFKWIWNKQNGLLIWEVAGDAGYPWHEQKCQQEWGRDLLFGKGDYLGYALPNTPEQGVITLESWDEEPIPPGAFAAVKTQLSEWFPHDQVVDSTKVEQHEFTSNPQDYRTAAIEWAQKRLGGTSESFCDRSLELSKPTRGKTGLLGRLFSRKRNEKLADADMDGSMVGLFLDEETAKRLQVKDGEPIENMHITLLYFKDKAAERSDWDEVKKIVEQVANQTKLQPGKVSGYGVFSNDEDVLWASPSIVGLAELRHKLFEACEDAGFHVDTTHDWQPHITLKYGWKGKLPKVEDIELDFKTLSFAQGNKRDDFEFKGGFEKRAKDTQADPYEDDSSFSDRTPYIYFPHDDHLVKGSPGQYHYSLEDWIHNQGWETNVPAIYGSIYTDPYRKGRDFQEVHQTGHWPNAWAAIGEGLPPDKQEFLERRVGVPFGGQFDPELYDFQIDWNDMFHQSSDDYLDWSGWEGAHRFVTDGKEILTDPETEPIDESQWRDAELEKKFRSFYPDSKSLVSGWTVPTADKMGIGIHAPAAGHGDKHEPGLHDLIAIIEKEFGKPAHLITNHKHIADEGMYNPGTVTEWQTL